MDETNTPERYILHMDQDAFYVSVELRKDPSLRGKPVIIGAKSLRGVVSSCSYEARKFGVRSAMPSKQAYALCPQAIFIRGNMAEYVEASREVTNILKERVPVIEKASIDEHYIDLSGMEKYHNILEYARNLRATVIANTGLPISFGLSVNKTVAKMATNACKPNGELFIPRNEVLKFIHPLNIDKIPGLGKKTAEKLRSIGIVTIKDLSAMNPQSLYQMFGKSGLSLSKRSNGIDLSPVEPYYEQKSFSTQRTLSSDTTDTEFLTEMLTAMATELAYDLRKHGKVCASIAVIIRYGDFTDETRQCTVQHTSLDNVIISESKRLFKATYQTSRKVRLIGLRLSNLIDGTPQLDLFDGSDNKIKLYHAMDQIRDRFGAKLIKPAAALGLKRKDDDLT